MTHEQLTEQHKATRIGQRRQNNNGSWMTIIEYNNARDLTVKFDTGYIATHKDYTSFKLGSIKDMLFPVVSDIGYLGIGNYTTSVNHQKTLSYKKWVDIIHRCYRNSLNTLAYQECTVCDEWKNYQNFAQWFEENYYEVPNITMSIDKDIIKKKNKIYCPEYCCFLPRNLNAIFERLNVCKRGKYPVGVSFSRVVKKFEAYTHKNGKKIHLGFYHTPKEAFYVYKEYKESYIRDMADKYKQWLPDKVYQAMYAYEIDIND